MDSGALPQANSIELFAVTCPIGPLVSLRRRTNPVVKSHSKDLKRMPALSP